MNSKCLLSILALGMLPFPAMAEAHRLAPIKHIIVISLENHSFDNLFGSFPGADGLADATQTATQADRDGKPYQTLPAVMDTAAQPARPDARFPRLANTPFPIERYIRKGDKTGDPTHRFFQEQMQINGGRMNRFAALSEAGGLVMGYYDGSTLGLWDYARRYTLADHFFHAAFGGSFLNHIWMICACTPRYEHAPEALVAHLDPQGQPVKDGSVTEDGYAINTIFPASLPHPLQIHEIWRFLPPQAMPTIGDRLTQKHIGWAWYAGGWNDAIAGKPSPLFQFHHQPFAYFSRYADGTRENAAHLKDESEFFEALKTGDLPAVAFYKPLGEFNLHPGYAAVGSGDTYITKVLKAIEASPVWESSVVIVTFDENGGFWDHVPPPRRDRFGPGVRVPTLIISPFARRGFVDHRVYDTTSILKLIEDRFGLTPLTQADAHAGDLAQALEFPGAGPQ